MKLSDLTPAQLTALNNQLQTLASQARVAIDQRQFAQAQVAIEQVLALVPNHTVALNDLGFVKQSLNRFDEAYGHYMDALKFSGSRVEPNIYDSIVSVCCELHREEEAWHYAKLSLQAKRTASLAQAKQIYPIPAHPPKGLSPDRKRNIISYSLYGNSPRYCETAVVNVALAREIYPEWTCRFYVDDSVPANVLDRLRAEGAEVVSVSPEWRTVRGLFWRFAVISDPNVQCFLLRDADSLLSNKERAAVDEWLASSKWFHVMRDHLKHSELILAGMWGGYTGVFHDIFGIIRQQLNAVANQTSIIDQVFLRTTLFPTVIQSALVHDSRALDKNTLPYPDYPLSEVEKIPYFHIGMVDAGAMTVTINIGEAHAQRICWQLNDAQNREICRYENDVPANRSLPLNLPYFYARRVATGEYHFSHQVVA